MGSHTVKSISVDELERRLEDAPPPFLLDVREPEELADGAIAGSVCIPMGEVQRRLAEVPTDRDVVVICHLGARSAYITRMLNGLGYDRVVNLSGGMEAWLSLRPRGPHHAGD